MRPRLLTAVVAGAVLALAVPTAADAAGRPTGIDVSFPQCGTTLPAAGFAVVGVNHGVGRTDNECLPAQLAYAAATPGRGHNSVDVYVNAQNPAPTAAATWPTDDVTFDGHRMRSPYGHCSGGVSRACSWIYGASIARDDVARFGKTGYQGPVGRWWIDVESSNSWSKTSTSRNRAALEGMVAAFSQTGRASGLYSSVGEFHDIVGTVPATSSLWKLPSWVAAGTTQGSAERLCSHAPLAGGRMILTQWRPSKTLDRDVACGVLTKAPKPKIAGHYRVGKKLTAKAGSWGPGSVHLAYRWTRDGHDIAKATHRTYVLKKADKRHRIAVRVTATETGYSRSVRTSASHRIPR